MISISYSSHSVYLLSTFYWSWSICPSECGRSHYIAFLRMHYKRPCSLHLSVSLSVSLCLSLCVSLSPLTLLETTIMLWAGTHRGRNWGLPPTVTWVNLQLISNSWSSRWLLDKTSWDLGMENQNHPAQLLPDSWTSYERIRVCYKSCYVLE